HDELDALLRQWHQLHAERARGTAFQAVKGTGRMLVSLDTGRMPVPQKREPSSLGGVQSRKQTGTRSSLLRRLVMNRYSPIAAVLILLAVLIAVLLPAGSRPAYAQDTIMVPDGGKLEALDAQGRVRGACPLKH